MDSKGQAFHMLPDGFESYSDEERVDILQSMADRAEIGDYVIPFVEQQKEQVQQAISERYADINRKKALKKHQLKELNEQIKEIQTELDSLSADHQAGGFNQHGTVYLFTHENEAGKAQTTTVDPYGKVIATRPATALELQKTIYQQQRYNK